MTTFATPVQLFFILLVILSTAIANGDEQPTTPPQQVIRLAYRFAFEDEGVIEEGRQPTQSEVEAVLCQTDVFFTKSLQKHMDNPALAVVIKEADYAFEDFIYQGEGGVQVAMPASVNFTLHLVSVDNTALPEMSDILDALPTFDYNAYLTQYVWKSAPVTKNFFFEARGVVWDAAIVDPVTGAIREVDCPEGAKPEALARPTATDGGRGEKEAFNRTDHSDLNGFTLKIGFWDGSTRPPTDMEWEALICQIDHFLNQQLKEELNDDSIASYATMIHWEYLEEEFLPAQVNFTLEAFYGNETAVPRADLFRAASMTDVATANFISNYVTKAFPVGFNLFAQVDKLSFRGASLSESSSDAATTLAKANCPITVRSSDMASFEISFEFEEEHEREPTRDEIEAMICETNKFFQKTLREGLNDPSIIAHANNIDWTFNRADEFSSVVTFTLLSLYGDGSHVRGQDIFEIMQGADVQFLTEKYILNTPPLEQNLFYFSKNVYFSGSLGRDVTTSKIPNGVKCKNKDSARMAMFSIQIGFDTRTGAPNEQDVKGLMCQTNLFFEKRLREELKDETINSHATNIDWSYVAGSEHPAIVNFTSFTTYGDGSLVPGKLVYDIMAVIDVDDYVRNYVWNSEPYNINLYYDTRYVVFGGEINGEIPAGKLDKVVCMPPGLANGSPNATEASGPKSGEDATKHIETEDKHMTHLLPHS